MSHSPLNKISHADQWNQKLPFFLQAARTKRESKTRLEMPWRLTNWRHLHLWIATFKWFKPAKQTNALLLVCSTPSASPALTNNKKNGRKVGTRKHEYSKRHPDNTSGRDARCTSSFLMQSERLHPNCLYLCAPLPSAGYHDCFLSFVCICVLRIQENKAEGSDNSDQNYRTLTVRAVGVACSLTACVHTLDLYSSELVCAFMIFFFCSPVHRCELQIRQTLETTCLLTEDRNLEVKWFWFNETPACVRYILEM